MRNRKNKTSIRIDAKADAILLNRWVALVTNTIYNSSGTVEENIPISTRQFYQIQWENILLDIKEFFKNPLLISPKIAYSLLAFFFIFQGKHFDAHMTAFFIGAIAWDADDQTSHSGEPATITWTHTVASGTDGIITAFVSGLSQPNQPTVDGNAVTSINDVGNLRTSYRFNSSTGGRAMSCGGGNIKTGASISFTGVDQTTPIDASTSEDGTSSPNDMSLTTTTDGCMRVDVLGCLRDDSTTPTGTLDTGDLRCNPTTPQNQFRSSIFAFTNAVATASGTTRTWTTSAFNRWYSAFALKASGGGGGPSTAVMDIVGGDINGIPFER